MYKRGVKVRVVAALVLVLATVCWQAAAQSPTSSSVGKDVKSHAAAGNHTSTPTKSATKAAKPAGQENDEVQTLKQILAAQQQQIEQLRAALQEQRQMIEQALKPGASTASPAPNLGEVASINPVVPGRSSAMVAATGPLALPPPQNSGASDAELEVVKGELAAVADSANQTNQRLAKLETNVSDTKKETASITKGIAGFKFGGDLRLRSDNIFRSSNSVAGPAQNVRARYRLRFNIDKAIFEQADVHVQLGSGLFNNPLTYDSDYNGTVSRGPIFLSEVWGDYHPNHAFSLRGGKMSEVFADNSRFLLDDDVRLNGFQEVYKTKSGNTAVELRAGQYIFTNPNVQILPSAAQCASATPPTNCAFVTAGFPAGGKVRATNMFDQGVVVTAPSGDHWTHQFTTNFQLWRNPNTMQLATNATGSILESPYFGVSLTTGISGNGNGTTTKGGAIFTADAFQIGALTYRADYKSWKSSHQAFPLTLEFHASKNFGADFYNNALMGQLTLGETKKGGDIQFRYGWFYKQANSMLAQLTDDDVGTGAGVNLKTHMIRFDVGLNKFMAWQNILFIQNILASDDPARSFFVNAQHGQAQQYRWQSQLQLNF